MLNLFVLFFFAGIGAYSAYADIRYRRVKNVIIAWGCIAAAGVELCAFGPLASHMQFFLNIALGVIGAFFLWRMNFWAAGDGKFFIFATAAVSALLTNGIFPGVSSRIPIVFTLLCNAFVLAFVYIFVEAALFCAGRCIALVRQGVFFDTAAAALKRMAQPAVLAGQAKVFLLCGIALGVFSFLRQYVVMHVPFFHQYPPLLFAVMALTYPVIQKMLRRIPWPALAVVFIVLILAHKLDIIVLLGITLKFSIALGAIRAAIDYFIGKKEVVVIKAAQLGPNMLLAQDELDLIPEAERPLSRFLADGLTLEQAEHVKAYVRQAGRAEVRIYRTFPFVPFIMLSMAAAYFLQGRAINLLVFLYR